MAGSPASEILQCLVFKHSCNVARDVNIVAKFVMIPKNVLATQAAQSHADASDVKKAAKTVGPIP